MIEDQVFQVKKAEKHVEIERKKLEEAMLERKTYELCNGYIPAQWYKDFKDNKVSDNIDTTAIQGMYKEANLRTILPDFISNNIIEGISSFDHTIRGYDNSKAIVCGTETRTSSPIRIVREEDGMSYTYGIFPCGEGVKEKTGIYRSGIAE